jgi:phosphopentomutase
MKIERVFVIVLDGVGVGELPDAAEYGDEGSNTLSHTAEAVGGLHLPTLQSLGMGNIIAIKGVPPADMPRACYGKMRERSPGKDSVTGHWEMMGVVMEYPFPLYPKGFPPEIIHEFEVAIKTKTLGNIPASGTEIIYQLGLEHEMTGYPIIYTSADSVFQIAAHEGIIPVERLYEMCRIARKILTGRHGVGRVIARPFEGHAGAYRRTERRRDFPLDPPPTTLDALQAAGHSVHAIGKIREFFNGRGVTTWDDTSNNADHIAALIHAAQSNRSSLIFANLEDFDMLFGHRNEPQGFADALQSFDAALPQILEPLQEGDLLILTNDHGNDPTTPSTDHNREYAFLLAYSPLRRRGRSLGERASFSDISATIRQAFDLPPGEHGESFLSEVMEHP